MAGRACQIQNIEADPDIGGPGVLASFLTISWLTFIFAAFPAFHDLLRWWPRMKRTLQAWPQQLEGDQTNTGAGSSSMHIQDDEEELHQPVSGKFKELLTPICDLQAITGIAVIIAGFSQIKTISYYHEELIMSYWWLTLNSFWAARVDYMNEDNKDDPLRLAVRRATTLLSCILGISFQIYIYIRENKGLWDNVNGPCYRWSDNSSTWPWVAGTSLYCVALAFLLVPRRKNGERFGITLYFEKTEKWQDETIKWFRTSYQHLFGYSATSEPPSLSPNWSTSKSLSLVILSGFCFCFYWAIIQLLAVMSYGDGFYPFFLLVYIAFNIWNTYDIISLKVLNKGLIIGDETKMGFGQVLAVVLIVAVMFNAVDVFRSEPRRMNHVT